jgi:hypothetical protein
VKAELSRWVDAPALRPILAIEQTAGLLPPSSHYHRIYSSQYGVIYTPHDKLANQPKRFTWIINERPVTAAYLINHSSNLTALPLKLRIILLGLNIIIRLRNSMFFRIVFIANSYYSIYVNNILITNYNIIY